jgi:hypothetical protein
LVGTFLLGKQSALAAIYGDSLPGVLLLEG